jgi:integrase
LSTSGGWVFSARAERDFKRLDPPVKRRIVSALDRLAGDPPAGDVVKLTVRRRALAAWGWKTGTNPKPTGPRRITVKARHDALERIGLHEARHTFASLMIAAGVNAKALSTIMGHATIAFTFDVYGHLMPGGEDEARERIDGAPHLRAVGE